MDYIAFITTEGETNLIIAEKEIQTIIIELSLAVHNQDLRKMRFTDKHKRYINC